MEINWKKYFDAIWCLNFKPQVKRKNEILKEFERVNILNHPNFKFHETFSSVYDTYFYNNLLKDDKIDKRFCPTPGNFNASYGHYSIIKKSLIDNYDRILIIENDMRFLKDLTKIEIILENMPNFDIILFDYFMHCSIEEFNSYKKINEYYSEYENLASTGCYSLSKNGMNVLANLFEQKIYPFDVYTSKINLKGYATKAFTPFNLACQVSFKNSMNMVCDKNAIHSMYKKANLDYNNYNMNNGEQYNYGDTIEE